MQKSAAPSAAPLTCSWRNSGTSRRPTRRLGCEKNWHLDQPQCAQQNAVTALETIRHHHRPTREQSFQSRGSGSDDDRIGGGENPLRLAVEERDPRRVRDFRDFSLKVDERAARPSAPRSGCPAGARRSRRRPRRSRRRGARPRPSGCRAAARRQVASAGGNSERAPRGRRGRLPAESDPRADGRRTRRARRAARRSRSRTATGTTRGRRRADCPHPALTPGPDLGADVLDRLAVGAAQLLGQPEIERGRVDADEHVRARRTEARDERGSAGEGAAADAAGPPRGP